MTFTAYETCPFCGAESAHEWNDRKRWLVVKCPECGREIFLCSECEYTNLCNWHTEEAGDFTACICHSGVTVNKKED